MALSGPERAGRDIVRAAAATPTRLRPIWVAVSWTSPIPVRTVSTTALGERAISLTAPTTSSAEEGSRSGRRLAEFLLRLGQAEQGVEDAAVAPAEAFDDLREALSRLPEEHRVPLLLYYYDGKDTRMLAEELGLTQGGACARLYRARHKLRSLLEEDAANG